MRQLIRELLRISPASHEKTFSALQKWTYRFLDRHGLTLRRITRNITISESVLQERSNNLFASLAAIDARNPRMLYVNMDQTAIQYQMRPTTTVDFIGSRAIPIRLDGNSTERCTAALSVCSDGTKLAPFIIYKGTVSGRIAREFSSTASNYPTSMVYATQKSAWMDTPTMVVWIRRYLFALTHSVLAPFCLARGPTNVCLILVSLSAHLSTVIVKAIYNLGISLLIIPGGLTERYQPMDVGVIAPFKHWVREMWGEQDENNAFSPRQRRERIARLIETGWARINWTTVMHSFNCLLGSLREENPNVETGRRQDIDVAAEMLIGLANAE